jgi:long-chain acyl-CoA synthetase
MNVSDKQKWRDEYKLASGRFVYPESIENEIRMMRYVRNVMLYGEGLDYNLAIVVPDFTALQADPCIKQLLKDTLAESLGNEVLQYYLSNQIIVHLCKSFGGHEVPRKYLFIAEDFTVDNGMLTPSMKTVRPVVMKKYGQQLLALYQ